MTRLDDEVLPVTRNDVATPLVFNLGPCASSLFTSFLYPTQGGNAVLNLAAELKGLYRAAGDAHVDFTLAGRVTCGTHILLRQIAI